MDNPTHRNITTIDWLEAVKWFLGTLVLGIVGIYYTNKNSETELDLKRMEVDSKLIDAVSHQYNKDLQNQQAYLEFIAPFITTKELKEGVGIRLDSIEGKLARSRLTNISADIKAETKKAENDFNNISDKKKNALKSLEENSKSNLAPQSMTSLIEEQEKIAGDSVRTVGNYISTNIENLKTLASPPVLDNYSLVGPPHTQWCKTGYFVEFNDQLKVTVSNLSGNRALVKLANVISSEGQSFSGGTQIRLDNKLTLYSLDRRFKYVLSLDYIGAAGKNPFTKAAYITVATYEKQ